MATRHASPTGAQKASRMRWKWQTKEMEERGSAPLAELHRWSTGPGPWGSSIGGAGRREQEGTPSHSSTVKSRVLLELTLPWLPHLPIFLTAVRFYAGFRVLGEGKGSLPRENLPVSRGPARASSSLDCSRGACNGRSWPWGRGSTKLVAASLSPSVLLAEEQIPRGT